MSLKTLEPENVNEAFSILTDLSEEFQEFPFREYVFRGQQDSHWRLQTTYDRYWGGSPLYEDLHIKALIAQFRSGVTRLGIKTPLDGNLDWLEYARHHGLPAPLLDFTWSPFIALFFAFDGVREKLCESGSSAIYCLNLQQLAREMARNHADNLRDFSKAIRLFLHEGASHFKEGFPQNRLIFLRYPGAHTRRMHVQLGTFLYSTLSFGKDESKASDLEDYFHHIQEGFDSPLVPNEDLPVLLKVVLPHAWVERVFSRLEVMGISGSSMYLSAEGVAKDVYNAFNFLQRAAFLRDEIDS